jgi:hypothetical protein
VFFPAQSIDGFHRFDRNIAFDNPTVLMEDAQH